MRNTPSRATSKKGNPKNRVIPFTRPKPGPVPGHGLPIQKPRRPIPIRRPGPVKRKTKFRNGRVTIRKEGKQWIISINGIPKFKSSTKKLANQKATLLRFQMK